MDFHIHYNSELDNRYFRVSTDERGIITEQRAGKEYLLGKSIAYLTEKGYKCLQQPAYIANAGWAHFWEVYNIFDRMGYSLNYSRPAGVLDPHPYESCIDPSFTHWQFKGNNFQLIWNRQAPRQVYLNHANPDVYNHIREALTEAGYILLDKAPNR